MSFDSSAAWSRAIDWVKNHMGMILPLAGIFILLPSLALVWFTGDLQADIQAKMQSQSAEKDVGPLLGLFGQLYGLILLLSFVQSIGTMAMTAVFADRDRPTVGEAITHALRCLPTVIGAAVLTVLLFLGVTVIWSVLVGLLAVLIGSIAGAVSAGLAGVIAAIPFIGFVIWLGVRLALVSPIIVLERVTNPIEAIRRSMRITDGNSASLVAFFLLLGICYMVISFLVEGVVGLATGGGFMTNPAQIGDGARIASGLASGILGAAAATVFTAVVTACYEQLSRTGEMADSDLFS